MSVLRRLAVGAALVAAGCGFSPTSPFEGFDAKGTRLSGSFDSGAVAQDSEVRASASPQGIRVSVKEQPSTSAVVSGDGRFVLEGVPAGSWSLIFVLDGQEVGEIRFRSVRKNQEIRIVVALTSDNEVVLTDENRDQVSFEGECPRGAGFWCQNQGGKNPNLSAEEFQRFAEDAAKLFLPPNPLLPELDTREEIAAAVCNTGDQLLRQLATLALNLASGTLTRGTALTGETYANVGAAFDAAVAAVNNDLGGAERNAIKDVLERTNESQNTGNTGCLPDDEDDDGDDDEVPPTGKVTICHIPPGNPAKKHTLSIGVSAWPAHKAHGDTLGACGS